MTGSVTQSALYRLLTFLSPAFPIGAFTYSHGLEQVIHAGGVSSAEELRIWLKDILAHGAGRSDAILMSQTYRAALAGSHEDVRELAELGLALQPSKERHLETSAQGTAFIDTVTASWPPNSQTTAGAVFSSLTNGNSETPLTEWPYPVALGLICAAHELPEDASLTAFLHSFTANLISAAVRAVPLGQNEGQRVLAALEPVISEIAAEAMDADLDDLGTSTFLADIASMAHETQYSRLFRS
ncbi:urease accessory protein UreF [Roseibium alexandrii]|uniref:Urease accessory protein UreF n=1 Tax=Roseibium alexandrii (strain DSM 17067 / NCIMB 14079 / DFL-11) TaxID=244592 RepID=A0A5E8H409_ROSAD|nr:urease accessory protein UreF [Roseibium alexandrii]EEE46872.1 Urease accessory protein UreF [Roseibium alexandrii DFL-11]